MLNKIKTEDLLKIYDGDLQGCIVSQMSELQNEVKKKELYLAYFLSEGVWSEWQKKRLESVMRQLMRLRVILQDTMDYKETILE